MHRSEPLLSCVPALLVALTCVACGGDARSLPASPPRPAAGAQAASPPPTRPLDAEVAATVDRVLSSAEHPGLQWSRLSDVATSVKPLYDAEPDRLLWFDGAAPSASLAPTVATIREAGEYGLDAEDYDADFLADQLDIARLGRLSAPERAHFDLAVTVAAARMLKAVRAGRVDPASMQWGYEVASKQVDVTAALGDARQRSLHAALDALEPKFTHYVRARRTLAHYRELARAGEPEPVPELPKGTSKLAPGKAWPGVGPMAVRLHALGDLQEAPASASTVYTGGLVDAVKRFQERHGLERDGVLGAGTIKALNVPFAQRVRQIELAMERMRWLPTLSERPNVFVNVPLFRMWATDPVTGEEPLRMNVVVGQSLNHRTPIFVEEMEYVIFRPYWSPPRGITLRELIPHARRDPSYLSREELEIVASGDDNATALPATPENLTAVAAGKLSIRQRPGPRNALGLAKFIFPNDENVYMHGTPAQALFSRARRDFSHGCVRLEDPARFAEWVLRDQPQWTRARIDAAMQGQRPTRVNLKEKLTVVLFYDTVHVNSENVVFFVDDIYGHDRDLDAALAHGYPYPTHKG